jgi:hypothetical protein
MADVIYQAQLDDSQVLKALQNIDKNIDKLAKDASREFEGIGKAAKNSGVNIGVMSGVVSSLVTEFINLGKQAISALIEIGKQSVQTAIEMDTLKARLGGIFDGSEEAADQAFTFIQQKSKELGIDLSELAGAFIPKTENLAQFERVAKIATALARSDPEQGAIGARIALIEALSGTFTSIQRRFEIPKEDIDRIKEAFDTKGIEGFLTTLEQVLDESGKSFDDLANTASTSFAKLGIAGQQLGGRLGTPILESLEEASNKILDFINTNENELVVFADTIGRAIADAIDFLSGIDLSQFDGEQLNQIADYIFRIVEATKLAAIQFGTFLQSLGNFPGVSEIIEGLVYEVEHLDEALVTLSQIFALINANIASLVATVDPLGGLFSALAAAASGDFVTANNEIAGALAQTAENLTTGKAGQDAFNASILESAKSFEDYKNSLDGNEEAQSKLRDTLKEQADAGTGAADSILELAQAQKQAEQDADKLAEAQAKVNEKMAEAQKDFDRKLEDIDIQTERKRLDIAIEFAQKREDAATDNLRKLEDIREKYSDDVDDAAIELGRKEEDIARKFGEQKIDQEREVRQKRVDIERDFRLKIQEIQRQFLLDAEEAEQKRDAVAFIRALKERDKKVQDAQIDRGTEIQELRISNEQKTEELRLQQQRELEEARIANERKLEDLRLNLDRQIEEQNENYGQQLEDLSLAEARKNEELNTWREREIEDANLAYARKLEDLKVALAEELAIIAEFAAQKAALLAEAEAAETKKVSSSGRSSGNNRSDPSSQGFGATPNTISTTPRRGRGGRSMGGNRRAEGGSVSAGHPYIVGERGPELFTPNQGGMITPNNAMTMPNFSSGGGVSNITTNNSKSASLGGLLDASSLDAILVAKIQNQLLSLLDRMS